MTYKDFYQALANKLKGDITPPQYTSGLLASMKHSYETILLTTFCPSQVIMKGSSVYSHYDYGDYYSIKRYNFHTQAEIVNNRELKIGLSETFIVLILNHLAMSISKTKLNSLSIGFQDSINNYEAFLSYNMQFVDKEDFDPLYLFANDGRSPYTVHKDLNVPAYYQMHTRDGSYNIYDINFVFVAFLYLYGEGTSQLAQRQLKDNCKSLILGVKNNATIKKSYPEYEVIMDFIEKIINPIIELKLKNLTKNYKHIILDFKKSSKYL